VLEVLASKRDGYPLISGHRGAAGSAPENTMAAFAKGRELGADLLEFDVQLTSDGEVVICHDATLDRTTNGQGYLGAHALAELRELDAGSWFGPEYRNERIPTLEELVAWAQDIRLNVELKSGPYPFFDLSLATKVVQILEKYNRIDDCLVISFDHILIAEVKRLAPGLACAINFGARLVDPVSVAKSSGANILNMSREYFSPELINTAHNAGLGLQCYCEDPQEARYYARMGVDFMDSDHPHITRAAVRSLTMEELRKPVSKFGRD